ncbi:hypothetical protein HNP38_002487 [Chryseobacterium defluvii]|uniref:Uncharacterized protein n=1 Tax=Chryseobacterium defluvii TaxID=160396 RepID=A0A840KI67_9FLAO|nr:hypothetical protein [Chryseobacterium defluvii]MBB4807183.1 hypothetical protein [Chryseobacterium defluvii]
MATRTYKTETLLKRLENYDQKYYDAICKPSNIGFSYGMRAYHALKIQNPPEWRIRSKAEVVAEELRKRGVKFSTHFLKLSN